MEIILLSIVVLVQTIVIWFLNKEINTLMKGQVGLYAMIHKKFNITVQDVVDNCNSYIENNIDFNE